MVNKLEPIVKEAQKKKNSFWDNLRELFKWS